MEGQKPSVGRIVHYSHSGTPLAAIITMVHTDTTINLTVFAQNGDSWGRQTVSYNEDRVTHGTWSWPPRV